MSKFKYDIFISYKRGKNESNENGYKYLGLSVARMLKLSLEKEGYDVYFDCDTEDKGKSSDKAKQNADDKKALETLVAMEKSRLVLLLLTGYSFDNEDGKTVAITLMAKAAATTVQSTNAVMEMAKAVVIIMPIRRMRT